MTDAYYEGRNAYENQVDFCENPYQGDDPRAYEWEYGWLDAEVS